MSFVARPPAAALEQPPLPETTIINDGFFPDVDPAAVRDEGRITTTITPARLRAAIIAAIMTAEIDLRGWASAQKDDGTASLADVPAPKIDGKSTLLHRYLRAVTLFAKAELIERYRDFDTTAAGGSQADDSTDAIGELRRDARHAVRDILGTTRTSIDLI